MERPIAYDKLAREDRLVRMRAREVAQLKVDQGLPPFPDLLSRESIKERVHGIMVGELQAMEGAGRTVYDFPDAPWEFTMDMARQTWDESRHVEVFSRLIEHLGGYIGEFPETTILWRCACAEDAAARVAGVNRGLEGLACDVFVQLVEIARRLPDPTIAQAVDYVLADEITHVRMGSYWLNKLTEGDPERHGYCLERLHRVPPALSLWMAGCLLWMAGCLWSEINLERMAPAGHVGPARCRSDRRCPRG